MAIVRDMVTVVKRFFAVHKEVLEAKRQSGRRSVKGGPVTLSLEEALRLSQAKAEMEMLAWVLGIDLAVMNMPKTPLPDGIGEPVERVTVSRVALLDCWHVEFPANPSPEWRTEYWGALISSQEMYELASAVLHALSPVARSSVVRAACVERLDAASVYLLPAGGVAADDADVDLDESGAGRGPLGAA